MGRSVRSRLIGQVFADAAHDLGIGRRHDIWNLRAVGGAMARLVAAGFAFVAQPAHVFLGFFGHALTAAITIRDQHIFAAAFCLWFAHERPHNLCHLSGGLSYILFALFLLISKIFM